MKREPIYALALTRSERNFLLRLLIKAKTGHDSELACDLRAMLENAVEVGAVAALRRP